MHYAAAVVRAQRRLMMFLAVVAPVGRIAASHASGPPPVVARP
jgi:hypothetical protein